MSEIIQEIVYRIRIGFSETNDIPLRSAESFLRLLGEVDCLLAYTVGMDLSHQSSLREMSDYGFHYDMKLRLIWPPQDFLGGLPDRDGLEQWLGQCRKYMLDCLKGNILSVEQIAWQWGEWAMAAGLTNNLIYFPVEADQIKSLMVDLQITTRELGDSTFVLLQ